MLNRIVIPLITRRARVVPLELAAIRIDSNDGRYVKVVEARRAFTLAEILRPGETVARSDVDKILIRVIGHAVPHRSTAAVFPPFAGPGLGCGFHGFVLESFRGIAGNRVEAPELLAIVGIECREISPEGREVGAGVPNENLSLSNSRGHGDRVRRRFSRFTLGNRPWRPDQFP